jgi:5-oxoprolinase (ATP-hydrolysing) subunit C
MTRKLNVLSIGPSCQIQGRGRTGYYRFGVPESGAMDNMALHENATLLGQSADYAVLEMAGFGGKFEVTGGVARIALTGAAMRSRLNGTAIDWNTTHLLEPGQVLDIGPVDNGIYGYLGIGGGFDVPKQLGSRATLARSSLGGFNGRVLADGDSLPLAVDNIDFSQQRLAIEPRGGGGKIRVLWGPQCEMFPLSERQRFCSIDYRVDRRLNRMGMRLNCDAEPLTADGHLSGVSDAVSLGDIQIPGDGYPAVLMMDRQTTGGYPRIATIIQADISRMVQAKPDSLIRFVPVDIDQALEALAEHRRRINELSSTIETLNRDPATIHDLLNYQLVSGAIVDDRLPWES